MLPVVPRKLIQLQAQRINRAPSPALAISLPWLLVMIGSLSPTWPVIASFPLLPPIGFLFLVAWLQMRPGLFPVWAGLPLGLFDDLYSGQPFGSGVLLWSLVTIGLDYVETRFPWRGFVQNWLLAAATTALYLCLAALIAGGSIAQIGPQVLLAVLLYPLLGRVVGMVDRLRLLPVRPI
jgi:rod shape-determining protein MreD